jgi:phosphoribosyl 1,2-cyclic phosphodiesterase
MGQGEKGPFQRSSCFMLKIKRKMNIIKQHDGRDNAHHRSHDILEFSKIKIKIK